MEIGELIKQRRLELKLTLEEVGNAVGVSKSTVKKWEDGFIANMKRDKIANLASVLRLSPIVLMGLDDNSVEINETNNINLVKIAGRDGRYIEKRLTDEQVKALEAIIEQLPDAPDDL